MLISVIATKTVLADKLHRQPIAKCINKLQIIDSAQHCLKIVSLRSNKKIINLPDTKIGLFTDRAVNIFNIYKMQLPNHFVSCTNNNSI